MNDYELIDSFLIYCKNLMGSTNWEIRFSYIKQFLIDIKTKPIIIEPKNDETGITYISPLDLCKDIPMWYLFNLYCYLHNSDFCDLCLIARIIPKIIRIAQSISKLCECDGFSQKLLETLNPNNKNFENTLFEILVASVYLRNGAKKVSFLFDKTKKMADLSVNLNGLLYVECKRKAKESNYNKIERKAWYKQYTPIEQYLTEHHISLVLKVTFHKEIITYPPNYLYSITIDKIKNEKIFKIENEDISVETYEPDFDAVNKQGDSMWKRYSPRFFKFLFNRDNDLYGITPFIYAEKGNPITDYVQNITEASAGIWYCDSQDALLKKSLSFKRLICEAIEQIPDEQSGAIHIGYESYDGNIVEGLNFQRTLMDIICLNLGKKKIEYIYIHNIRLMLPPDKDWDVEETVIPFQNPNTLNNQLLIKPHIITY